VTESSWNQPKHHQISDKKREWNFIKFEATAPSPILFLQFSLCVLYQNISLFHARNSSSSLTKSIIV
jgi:hypothetical protein